MRAMKDKRLARVLLLGALLSLLLINFMGEMTFHLRALELQISLKASRKGLTEIHIPPVGSITARTHATPLKIRIDLLNIDPDGLQDFIKEAPASPVLAQELKEELIRIVQRYLVRLNVLAVLGGLLAALIITGRERPYALAGAVTGLLVAALLLGLTYATYQPEKFKNPEYQGVLKAAPWAVGMVETAYGKLNVLSQQMQVIAANLYTIFERIDKISPVAKGAGDLLVLHVTDIHNNPAANSFVQHIAKSFPLDMIIDTGDITDYGTPLEARLLTGLMELKVPYVFIPGNHDSPYIIKELGRYPQVQVLTGGTVNIQGLRILALADPASGSNKIAPPGREELLQARTRLESFYNESSPKPHLIAVHNYNLAEPLIGRIPLILHGHSHYFEIREEQETVIVNAGTTGGAGLRGLQATKEIPYSVALLHFQWDGGNDLKLTAIDTIKVFNMERGFTLERKIYDLPLQTKQ